MEQSAGQETESDVESDESADSSRNMMRQQGIVLLTGRTASLGIPMNGGRQDRIRLTVRDLSVTP